VEIGIEVDMADVNRALRIGARAGYAGSLTAACPRIGIDTALYCMPRHRSRASLETIQNTARGVL